MHFGGYSNPIDRDRVGYANFINGDSMRSYLQHSVGSDGLSS